MSAPSGRTALEHFVQRIGAIEDEIAKLNATKAELYQMAKLQGVPRESIRVALAEKSKAGAA